MAFVTVTCSSQWFLEHYELRTDGTPVNGPLYIRMRPCFKERHISLSGSMLPAGPSDIKGIKFDVYFSSCDLGDQESSEFLALFRKEGEWGIREMRDSFPLITFRVLSELYAYQQRYRKKKT